MGFLTDYEDAELEYRGRVWHLDLAYDSVLNAQRMFRERKLDDADMLMTALAVFGIAEKDLARLSWQERSDLLQLIYDEKLKTRSRPRTGKPKILFDFEEDGEYIYASFLQDYSLDLVEQQGKLSWRRFMALFESLSDGTKIKEVMRIRGMEIPSPTKTNRKEIENLMEMKAYYALGYKEYDRGDGLERLFSTLEAMA